MKAKFAVQMTDLPDDQIHRIVDALKAIGANYDTFGLIAFTDIITNVEAFEDATVVVPLGSTKLISMYLNYKLPDHWRVFYNPMVLDQFYAESFLGFELLNADGFVQPFAKIRSMRFEEPMFIKPTNDLKLFSGMVLEVGQSLDDALQKITHQEIKDEESILVAHPQNIGREFRLFIVDDQISSLSQYRDRGRLSAKALGTSEADMLLGESIYTYFEGLRSYNLPAPRAYAMDICELLTDEGPKWKIVECNCFNASGMYAADQQVVYRDVLRYVQRVYG